MDAVRDRRAWVACVAAIAAMSVLAGASVPASAAGDHGPLTCLDGYVWRQATPRDRVCVAPAVRAQTARDNALAASRAGATPGTFGPDLCVSGYVWREAVPGDHVCVTPATWQQVQDASERDHPRARPLVAARDPSSRRWSSSRRIATDCAGP
jgi:hypothetical protein